MAIKVGSFSPRAIGRMIPNRTDRITVRRR
jgi:hypothetical protein